MNLLDSECSSGCESGWTLYLEQSFLSPNSKNGESGNFCKNIGHDKEKGIKEDQEEEEEEDLSMVSDASSGPPQYFHEDDNQPVHLNDEYKPFCFMSKDDIKLSKSGGKKGQKMKDIDHQQGLPSFLDDTASSPVFNFSNNMQDFALTNNQGSMESVLDYSQGFSASTHFQGRVPAFQDPFGSFLHSSLSGNQLQEMS
ncbi:hypothetical protein L484_005063 [Morus notabilis]|uniref:Uncharacterized protein n=1 Tax=Morus notabilis TaxID=981085 RepID=W9R8V8_9ROSA|nr:hypothetical protein L484_005063 [Morus notabilis]